MSLCRKLACAAAVPALLLLGTGCGGLSASQGVSPASFFLPGLVQSAPHRPPSGNTATNTAARSLLAQSR